ncbi:endonuclease-3 [Cnuella takakiae]|uniref:Endonuclease-3 n=1 Tax=Cnuella takakiae TaxID=1302690 RepID=A0A1M4Y6A6_9BACT|nr:DNA lyase [Cnuella takakiae]OLY93063.1 DNA lyase [Cnuella takakiae]SHF01337.1 endonuclease-3 [Cnuella takakiae]
MKQPFSIDEILARIEAAVRPFPKAALFELYERGYQSIFEQLVACIISIRTLDETTIPVALKLFGLARTPADLKALPEALLETLLIGSTFPGQKAQTLLRIAATALQFSGGNLPASPEVLTGIKGVGPKCANLALGITGMVPAIGVDIHVHRVSNRWGYVHTKTPEQTLGVLEGQLPCEHWVTINRLLVPFGKHICTGILPHCSTCPVLEFCQQVGVTRHR